MAGLGPSVRLPPPRSGRLPAIVTPSGPPAIGPNAFPALPARDADPEACEPSIGAAREAPLPARPRAILAERPLPLPPAPPPASRGGVAVPRGPVLAVLPARDDPPASFPPASFPCASFPRVSCPPGPSPPLSRPPLPRAPRRRRRLPDRLLCALPELRSPSSTVAHAPAGASAACPVDVGMEVGSPAGTISVRPPRPGRSRPDRLPPDPPPPEPSRSGAPEPILRSVPPTPVSTARFGAAPPTPRAAARSAPPSRSSAARAARPAAASNVRPAARLAAGRAEGSAGTGCASAVRAPCVRCVSIATRRGSTASDAARSDGVTFPEGTRPVAGDPRPSPARAGARASRPDAAVARPPSPTPAFAPAREAPTDRPTGAVVSPPPRSGFDVRSLTFSPHDAAGATRATRCGAALRGRLSARVPLGNAVGEARRGLRIDATATPHLRGHARRSRITLPSLAHPLRSAPDPPITTQAPRQRRRERANASGRWGIG